MKQLLFIAAALVLFSCNNNRAEKMETTYKTTGHFENADPAFDSIVGKDAKAEIIAEGFEWSEGPLWLEKENKLIFSDVPANTIYGWTEAGGKEVYLKPSGYTDSLPTQSKEPGSNGLTLDPEGRLVLCQHGNRQVARMDAALNKPEPRYIALATRYNGKRFSSPNDLVFSNNGELFFTDPPYGLPTQGDTDSLKELPFNGVFKVKKDGTVILLADSITRPNGLALFPGEKRLLVACSDPQRPNWYVWDVEGDSLRNGRLFYSAAEESKNRRGLPDGCKIDKNGNVYATGPGGVYFFNAEGKKLGMLQLDHPASNCALSPDEKILYVTNDMFVLRVKLR